MIICINIIAYNNKFDIFIKDHYIYIYNLSDDKLINNTKNFYYIRIN